jgi:hypothetical protein
MRAIEQQTTGNFLCLSDGSQAVIAVISRTSRGWRVFNSRPGHRNGRTYSTTPEDAARKYFREPVTFVRLTKVA